MATPTKTIPSKAAAAPPKPVARTRTRTRVIRQLDMSSPVRRCVVYITLALLSLKIAASFVQSFGMLDQWAAMAHSSPGTAWLLPISIDGSVIFGTVGAFMLPQKWDKRYSVFVLISGVAVSLIGNGLIHDIETYHLALPMWSVFLAAGVAPISMLLDVHIGVLLVQSVVVAHNNGAQAVKAAPAAVKALPEAKTPPEVKAAAPDKPPRRPAASKRRNVEDVLVGPMGRQDAILTTTPERAAHDLVSTR